MVRQSGISKYPSIVCILLFGLAFQNFATAQHIYKPFRLLIGEPLDILHREKPPTDQCDPIETLANQIDWLEAHVDAWGSVVAKTPDIWGEARLTKYREEYERTMREDLNDFEIRLNASIRTADSAFLMNSLALNGASAGVTPATASATAIGPGANVSLALPSGNFSGFADGGALGLEPTIELDQKSRYIQHLHELRRIHTGDDTSDSPGYSMNLVRLPISVLPGKKTREGFGAEIDITATPVLGDALMSDAIQNLVINDLVDMLSLPVLRYSEEYAILHASRPSPEALPSPPIERESPIDHNAGTRKSSSFRPAAFNIQESLPLSSGTDQNIQGGMNFVDPSEFERKAAAEALKSRQKEIEEKATSKVGMQEEVADKAFGGAPRHRVARFPLTPQRIRVDLGMEWIDSMRLFLLEQHYQGRDVRWAGGGKQIGKRKADTEQRMHLPDIERYMKQQFDTAYALVTSADNIQLLINTIESTSDGHSLARAILEGKRLVVAEHRLRFYKALRDHQSHLYLPGEDISVKPEDAVQRIVDIQKEEAKLAQEYTSIPLSSAHLLAWPVVVELALLNDYLHEDMIRVAASKGCMCAPPRQLPFYLPLNCLNADSPFCGEYQEASIAFQEYVRCRWPIHVFALDPIDQEQNVSDVLARRRELQLSLSLAFMSGSISANNLTQFARRLETEIQTVALNKTIVGFSHGSDTFGWQFYPRVQTPPPPGNVVAFGQTLFGGPSRDKDMASRQLEPGVRECVAIVLMPSFVPYCDFDIRSNWFKLTNPKNTEISMHDTMKLSRSIKAMQNSAAQCSNCQHLYRDGEVTRLLKRVHQLDQTLPLQTMRTQVPFENTLGGFEMFNTGMTDLAPELRGWYGVPGVVVGAETSCSSSPAESPCTCVKEGEVCKPASVALPVCSGSGTTLFLVGKNLSVHETRIIAGGVCIPHTSLISREIMQVTIPPCVQTVIIEGQRYVDIHAATPYGVTGHLHVPIVDDKAAVETLAEQVTAKVQADLQVSKLKLSSSTPILFIGSVAEDGTTIVYSHTTNDSSKTVIELQDKFKEFSKAKDKPDRIRVLAAIGNGSQLVTQPIDLTKEPIRLIDGSIEFNSVGIAEELRNDVAMLSRKIPLSGSADVLEYEVVFYYLLEDNNFPLQIDGLAKIKLQRERRSDPAPAFEAPATSGSPIDPSANRLRQLESTFNR